ncbi:hypothetical protein DFJ74DRAFT_505616 [Hyaloraphidium curvatum]|nr:hypothetical protein DFJ74DRAFT_505616 [Hyaloraphidium curvatum]
MAGPLRDNIEIQLKDADEVVEIDLTDVAENRELVGQVLELLASKELGGGKQVPFLYLTFALEFYKRKMFADFENFLRIGIETVGRSRDDEVTANTDLLRVCLAAYKTRKARGIPEPTEAKRAEKKALHEEAIQTLNDATSRNPFVILGKSLLLISQADYDNAMSMVAQFARGSANTVALLARAGLLYHKKEYKAALSAYQTVLRMAPKMKRPNPRIGIGLCYYQLGHIAEARKALLRAEEMDRSNDAVAAVLMQMDLAAFKTQTNAEDKAACMASAQERYRTARQLNNKSAAANLFRAEQLFLAGDLAQARGYANAAYTNADFPPITARALLVAGKIQHVQGNYAAALRNYERALNDWPDSLVVMYLMAQALIEAKDQDKAVETIESALALAPNEPNFLRLLISIYAKREADHPKAMAKWDVLQSVLRRQAAEADTVTTPKSAGPAVEVLPFEHVVDPDFCLELAQLHEELGRTELAFQAYRQAATLIENEGREVPVEIWNNLAALAQMQGNMEVAQANYQKALQGVTEKQGEKEDSAGTTVLYNIGRMYETLGEPDKAAGYFTKVVERHPRYHDACLRLGAIDWGKGRSTDAKNRFTDVTDIDETNVEAWIMIGLLQYSEGQLLLSRQTFDKILGVDKNELYALVQLGNILVEDSRTEKSKTKRAELLSKALSAYMRTISIDEFNSYAANGIGIVCAESGDFAEAERTFEMLKHNAPNLPWARVNRGHALVELGVNQSDSDQAGAEKQRQYFQTAITEFETSFRIHPKTRTWQTLLALARAYYIIGRSEKNVDNLMTALQHAEEAQKLNPNSKDLQHDIAQIKLFYGFSMEQRNKDQRTVEDLERALEFMKAAGTTFRTMSAEKPSSELHIEHNTLKVKAEYCEKTANDLKQTIDKQRAFERERAEQKEKAEQLRELERRMREEEEEQVRLKKQQENEALYQKRRQDIAEKEQQIQREREREAELARQREQKKGSRKSKKRDADSDGGASSGESDAERKTSRKRAQSKSESEEEDKRPKGKKAKRKRREESAESADSDAPAAEERKRVKKKKPLSEEVVREDVSDEDMEDAEKPEQGTPRGKLKRRNVKSDTEDSAAGEPPEPSSGRSREDHASGLAKEEEPERAAAAPKPDSDDDDGVAVKKRRKAVALSDDEE